MESKEYLTQSRILFDAVKATLDRFEDHMDYETADGKLEILFESGASRMVLNTQRALQEVWLAGNAKAWHFRYQPETQVWFADAEKVEFYQILSELLSEKTGFSVTVLH